MAQTKVNTNTIRLSNTDRGLRAATALLQDGGLIAFPTETVYGLGADARNPRAVAGVYEAKGRPSFNPLIVHVADLQAARAFGVFNAQAEALAKAFWPGALTLVVPFAQNAGVADLVTAGLPSIALRVPDHAVARALLAGFGGPIAAPSANPSGRISPTTADHVMEGLSGRIAGVVDGGATGVGVESTIIGLTDDIPRLLRPGGTPAEDVERALGQPLAPPDEATTISAPGQLASHYAPDVSLRLDADAADPGALWLAFGPLGARAGLTLSADRDLREAAANLFAHLHLIDALAREQGVERIFVDPVPQVGLGAAINDRLRRAAAPR